MAKGQLAKDRVIKKLKDVFGADYIGEYDKKHYVWVQDDGEKVQIAISLTCPKTPVATVTPSLDGGMDFSGDNDVIAPTSYTPAEITPQEQENIAALLERLGL